MQRKPQRGIGDFADRIAAFFQTFPRLIIVAEIAIVRRLRLKSMNPPFFMRRIARRQCRVCADHAAIQQDRDAILPFFEARRQRFLQLADVRQTLIRMKTKLQIAIDFLKLRRFSLPEHRENADKISLIQRQRRRSFDQRIQAIVTDAQR